MSRKTVHPAPMYETSNRCTAPRSMWRVLIHSQSDNAPSRFVCLKCNHQWLSFNKRVASQVRKAGIAMSKPSRGVGA